jgi:hypothetical protein
MQWKLTKQHISIKRANMRLKIFIHGVKLCFSIKHSLFWTFARFYDFSRSPLPFSIIISHLGC